VEREPHAAPVAAVHGDRCGRFLQHDEAAAAHVAAVGLQQERALVARRSEPAAVVEDPPTARMRGVPREIARALRLVAALVAARDTAVAVDRAMQKTTFGVSASTGSCTGGKRVSASATKRVRCCCGALPAIGR
jgi:hypothetical protein